MMKMLSKLQLRPLAALYVALVCTVIGACAVNTPESLLPQVPTEEFIHSEAPSVTGRPPSTSTLTATAMVEETELPATPELDELTPTPFPSITGPQIILNSGFDSGIKYWEHPYGNLTHTTSVYYTGPGAAQLTTSDEVGFLEYRGNIGQCINLGSILADWPMNGAHRYMRLEAYLKTDADITNASLNGIFSDDIQCGTGHIGFFEIPPIVGNQEWTKISETMIIPIEAKSLHVFISANGSNRSAKVYIDDIRAYSPEPGEN